MALAAREEDFLRGEALANLVAARAYGEGWFVAAPGYAPYGDFVWHRDNAECVMAMDEYASAFAQPSLFEMTAKAILRSFLYFESKRKGVEKLSKMRSKLGNPEFYDSSNHPHARVSKAGEELPGPWNNIQYDSVARMVIALAKHVSLTRDALLVERCKQGLAVALQYLTDSIWDSYGEKRVLTVSANEWEERDEPHLRGPLFSSVLGLLHASGRFSREVLQQYIDPRALDLEGYEKQTWSMLNGYFVTDGIIRMIKRFAEPPTGICSTSLWLLTSFGAFPPKSEVFEKTLGALLSSRRLCVELPSADGASPGASARAPVHSDGDVALRRYELSPAQAAPASLPASHVDTYWGGQAWIITTAQLSTAMAMRGDPDRARSLLSLCLESRDAQGHLPEQFEGTYIDESYHERWKGWSRVGTPAPWLAWSHAEVLRAFAAVRGAS